MDKLELSIFDLSPIAMWIQDFSGVKTIFEQWQAQGIQDIRQYLLEDPERLHPCLATIKTIHVNQSALTLYEAENIEEILQNFAQLHTEKISVHHAHFFADLWNKEKICSIPAINYTCTGKQIDIQLRANILPNYEENWECLLLTTENISDYQNARRFAESIFLNSPTALWVRDYSHIKLLFNQLKKEGVYNLEDYISQHPHFVKKCFENIKNIRVNQSLLDLFNADHEQDFFQHLWHIFRETSQQNFHAQLLALWDGKHQQQRECEYQTVHGDLLNVHEKLVVFPDSQHNWDTIQIAYTDFTKRKTLEDHLLYISKHDQLTQLYNRTFFNNETFRIQTPQHAPISCIFLDINGLKEINDLLGHDHGDEMLRRFGKILKNAIKNTAYSASRIGGDEFVILMPKSTQHHIEALLRMIRFELEIDQLKNPDLPIHVAIGYATTDDHKNIDEILKKADQTMYKNKRAYYLLSVNK